MQAILWPSIFYYCCRFQELWYESKKIRTECRKGDLLMCEDSYQNLADEVHEHHGLLVVKMERLRNLDGSDYIGSGGKRRILHALLGVGLRPFPDDLPNRH